MVVNKVSWQQVGHVTEPGRYMFRFGWLSITAADLAIWQQFPNAAFTLVKTATPEGVETPGDLSEDYRLGSFEIGESLAHDDR